MAVLQGMTIAEDSFYIYIEPIQLEKGSKKDDNLKLIYDTFWEEFTKKVGYTCIDSIQATQIVNNVLKTMFPEDIVPPDYSMKLGGIYYRVNFSVYNAEDIYNLKVYLMCNDLTRYSVFKPVIAYCFLHITKDKLIESVKILAENFAGITKEAIKAKDSIKNKTEINKDKPESYTNATDSRKIFISAPIEFSGTTLTQVLVTVFSKINKKSFSLEVGNKDTGTLNLTITKDIEFDDLLKMILYPKGLQFDIDEKEVYHICIKNK